MTEQLKIKDSFLKFLESVELLTKAHSGKNTVILDDIFIYPELEKYDALSDNFKKEPTEKLLRDFCNYSKILIAGESQSGKTTLCKKIFFELKERNFIPVYLSDKKKQQYAGKIQNKIQAAFEEQYEGVSFDSIETKKVVPIIDDFHFAKNKEKHIEYLLSTYEHSVVIVDDLFSLNLKDGLLSEPFSQFRIKEFAPSLRNKLIEKWLNLSDSKNSNPILPNERYHAIDSTTELVNSALGKIISSGIMPAYPFFILSIISAREALESSIDPKTSQGYCYQAIIYLCLRKEGVKNDEIDTYINFLTMFSFFIYKKGKTELSKEELKYFIVSYKEKYNLPIKEDILLEKLKSSRIIMMDNLGNYQFSYLYIYYFFVGKYISEHINENKDTIDFIIAHLHKNENAYIAVFISHHSKSSYILDEIRLNALCLFDKYNPAELTKDELSFFDKQLDNIIKEILPENNIKPELERADRLKKQDNVENFTNTSQKLKDLEEQEDNFAVELRRSMKTVEVMGLIIKNRAGSLEKAELENIFRDAMHVYLRILKSFFEIVEQNEELIIHFIQKKLEIITNQKSKDRKTEGKKDNALTKEYLYKISRRIFWNINFFTVYNIINKLIHLLGSNKLTEIINTVCDKEDTPAAFLVKHGILMWYNKNIQPDNIALEFNENKFSETAKKIMRCMIVNHCLMHSVNFKEKQKLSTKLDISLKRIQKQPYEN